MIYTVIHPFRVTGFNMLQNIGVLTPVPLMGAALFVHALSKKLGFSYEKFGLIVHSVEPLVDFTWHTTKRGDDVSHNVIQGLRSSRAAEAFGEPCSKAYGLPSAQPEAKANGVFSLVIYGPDRISANALEAALHRMRFVGGSIWPSTATVRNLAGSPHIGERKILSVHDTLPDALADLPRGDLVLSAKNVVESLVAEPGIDITSAVLCANKVCFDLEKQQGALASSYFVNMFADEMDQVARENLVLKARQLLPVMQGYSLLEQPRARAGVRCIPDSNRAALHACAEPMLGLVSLVSIRSFVRVLRESSVSLDFFLWETAWVSPSHFQIQAEPFGLGCF